MIPIIEEKNDLFIYLINKFNIKNGIEIGVREGMFARNILSRSNIKFYGLDINIHSGAKNLKTEYIEYNLIHGRSPDYSINFEDGFFDWIYIDAGHSYNNVKNDLEAWYPKLKNGGIFSGDDYMNFNNPTEGLYGVVEAVEEFVDNHDINEVYISHLGFVNKEARLKFGIDMGLKWPYPNCKVPQWIFIKK